MKWTIRKTSNGNIVKFTEDTDKMVVPHKGKDIGLHQQPCTVLVRVVTWKITTYPSVPTATP